MAAYKFYYMNEKGNSHVIGISKGGTMKEKTLFLLFLAGLLWVSSCYYYAPAPYVVTAPGPSYDYIWDSATRAAQDVGIQITSSNRDNGTMFGQRDGVGVTIQVIRQADGRTRVELTARGNEAARSRVSNDFYQAYERHMGRR